MVKKPQYTSAAVRSVFCLDSMDDYDYKGRLYIGTEKTGFAVSGITVARQLPIHTGFTHYSVKIVL